MSEAPPKRRWFRFSLRTLFIAVTVLGILSSWVVYQLNWIRQRNLAREWFTNNSNSWIAPDLVGAPTRAPSSWSLRVFGERGVVGLGIDERDSAAGTVPFTIDQLQRLFPEARVDYSRDGVWVDDASHEGR